MSHKQSETRTWIISLVLMYPAVVWVALKIAPYAKGGILGILNNFSEIMASPFTFTLTSDSLRAVFLLSISYLLLCGVILSGIKNFRHLEEHGSSAWGNAKAIGKHYRKKAYDQNKLMTKHVMLGLETKDHRRNLNTLVIGGSGAGKTRYFAKPNLMQANTSFVVLDPKGELLKSCGGLLCKKGYYIKVLDLIHLNSSYCYNPFVYLRDDADVFRLVSNIIRNTTPKSATSSDPFWEKSETALLEAIILYLLYEAPEGEQNFGMVMEMLLAAEVREEEEGYESPLDILFGRLALKDAEHTALKQYKIFKLAAGKTAKSILVSLGVRLEKFNIVSLRLLTNTDEMEFHLLGRKKCAIFAITPDNDSSLNFIVGMLYTQLFQVLYEEADQNTDGRLIVPVHFLMDEFANVALPDEFDKMLSTMRSREIFVSIILQNLAQLKALYEKQWESILGNCDTLLYLGGNEQSTHEYLSKSLGKETIDLNAYGQNKGRNGSSSVNYQKLGRELLTPDEVRRMSNDKAILLIRGEQPVMDEKYDLLKHPNIASSMDGGAGAYCYHLSSYEKVPSELLLMTDSEYELISEEELEELIMKENQNEEK